MDELLSFELSNAEFTPWIVPTQPEGRLEKFVRNEIEGDSFGDTVSNLIAVARDVVQNKGNSRLLSYQADVYEQPVWLSCVWVAVIVGGAALVARLLWRWNDKVSKRRAD